MSQENWFSVKCQFVHNDLGRQYRQPVYEERVVLFRADTFDEAVERAEQEASAYAADLGDTEFLGLSQAFHLVDSQLTDGVEVYSLMRKVGLEPEDYLSHYHNDGTQLSQDIEDDRSA